MPDIEELTELEREMARLEAEVNGTEETKETEQVEEPEEIQEEPTDEESPVEDVVEEPEEKEPSKDDHSAWAKMRREKAEAKRREEQLAAELAEIKTRLNQPQEQKTKKAEHPDPETDPEGYLAWEITELKKKVAAQEQEKLQAQQYSAAVQEFTNIINEYKAKTPDFDQASQFLEAEMRKAIRIQNPTLPQSQVQVAVNNQILRIASEYARQGLNPAEEFYSMAHEFGYKKSSPVEQPKPSPKVNLNNIDKTRQRSATGLGAGGATGKAGIGIDALNGMTVSDFAKLTPDQIRELESQV